jgi:hypothetical protein
VDLLPGWVSVSQTVRRLRRDPSGARRERMDVCLVLRRWRVVRRHSSLWGRVGMLKEKLEGRLAGAETLLE